MIFAQISNVKSIQKCGLAKINKLLDKLAFLCTQYQKLHNARKNGAGKVIGTSARISAQTNRLR